MDWQSWIVETAAAPTHITDKLIQAASFCYHYNMPGVVALRLPRELAIVYRQRDDLIFHPDFRLKPCASTTSLGPTFFTQFMKRSGIAAQGLNDVLKLIGAPDAWLRSTGTETYIAIVDSGINKSHLEFPAWKRADGFSFDGSDPWQDSLGHGTMCAAIAAGSPQAGARVSGVAPNARLYSCRINYTASEAIAAYEWIENRFKEHGKPIIVNNSFGFESKMPPVELGIPITPNHLMARVLRRMVTNGLPVVFAAGNNHNGAACVNPLPCSPDTIWAFPSLPEIMTVADIDQKLDPREFSSRGPGQWHTNTSQKPDCAAPTFGYVLFGDTYREADDGWGTSGAAPQVTGLLSLLASQRPAATPTELNDRVRSTCKPLNACRRCVGHGMIQCNMALW
jgi:serine protease AprX